MFAPKTKFPIFGAALPFPNTIITIYCFSAILKGLKLSSSSTAINLLRSILVPLQRSIPHSSTTASSFVVMFAPKTKFTSFGAALPFPNTIITNYCFSAFLKECLNLSSSLTAVNTSQLDNCQSFCCHVCPENKVSEFWRRSTLSKYNYYKLLLLCNFKKMFESKQFFFSGQYLTV